MKNVHLMQQTFLKFAFVIRNIVHIAAFKQFFVQFYIFRLQRLVTLWTVIFVLNVMLSNPFLTCNFFNAKFNANLKFGTVNHFMNE